MLDYSTFTDAELDEALTVARAEMVSFAQQAEFCRGRVRKQCLADHDAAETLALAILAEMSNRRA